MARSIVMIYIRIVIFFSHGVRGYVRGPGVIEAVGGEELRDFSMMKREI